MKNCFFQTSWLTSKLHLTAREVQSIMSLFPFPVLSLKPLISVKNSLQCSPHFIPLMTGLSDASERSKLCETQLCTSLTPGTDRGTQTTPFFCRCGNLGNSQMLNLSHQINQSLPRVLSMLVCAYAYIETYETYAHTGEKSVKIVELSFPLT